MSRRRVILVAEIACLCAVSLVALVVLLIGSTRGECVLSFGRLDCTARSGLLVTRLFRDEDTRWESADAYFRAYTQASITWWSFDAGRGRSGWKPIREVDYLIVPMWVLMLPPLIITCLCGRALRRARARRCVDQCEGCGYALAGLVSGTPCPECGRALASVNDQG